MSHISIHTYLRELTDRKGSDMYLTVGCNPSIRIDDKVTSIQNKKIEQEDIDNFTHEILTKEQSEEFKNNHELNISFIDKHNARFRFNFFHQKEKSGLVIRRINMYIPTLDELGLPETYARLAMAKSGLVLLASPAGSGKTTSMAAMIGHRNKNGSGHILTIEDPIEYVHDHISCIVTQREVGEDTLSFSNSLKNAFRQRADVVGIGEIRDREVMEQALRFSETGHLCISTIHANGAAQAIDRIINFFPGEFRNNILLTLSQNLKAVLSQRIIQGKNGKKLIAVEILLNEGLIKTLIADNRLNEIEATLDKNPHDIMHTMDQAVLKLLKEGKISYETALSNVNHVSNFKLLAKQNNLDPSDPDKITSTIKKLSNGDELFN